MLRMRFGRHLSLLATLGVLLMASMGRAQDPQQESSSKPPDAAAPSPAKKHIGDYDAAIDRFQDAIEAKPGYAIPFRYLGEAQEKKGQKKQAIKSYQRYLDLYPHAEDGAKIKKKLEKLYKEVEKEKKD